MLVKQNFINLYLCKKYMKAIIIAAGMGNRLLHMTIDKPKCKLKVYGKPIIEHQLDIFKDLGIKDITIVKGFLAEQINYPETKSYYNDDYKINNILASLFYAENELNDDVIITYSDIIFNKETIEKTIMANGDVCIVVDEDWRKIYENRENHPIDEAEKVVVSNGKIKEIGKHLKTNESDGEFIGLVKLSKRGTTIFKDVYHNAFDKYKNQPFQNAQSFKKAYLTDIFQELIDQGYDVIPVLINGGWIEIDTLEDLKKAGGEILPPKISPEFRRSILKNVLKERGFARFIEAHSGISAIVANNTVVGNKIMFDGIWVSSLTESAAKGYPDIEIVSLDSRLNTVSQILDVTNKPIIVDGDTGGDPNIFEYFVRKAESLGVSAVIIEDKIYPKRNSLDSDSEQILEDPGLFANKIKRGKNALLTSDFMIIARIESFIAGKDLNNAIERAKIYLEAGADGIMIHSKSKFPDEVISFAKKYKELKYQLGIDKPLFCVPTTYNSIKESEIRNEGFNVVIYANHLLRASVKSMQHVCKTILENERAFEAEEYCSSLNEVFDIVGYSDIKNKENKLQEVLI